MNAAERTPPGPRTLRDAELELVIDGVQPGEPAQRAERVLASPGPDAARLEELRAFDAIVREALLAPPARAARPVRRTRVAPLLIAAALLLAVGLAVFIRLAPSVPPVPVAPSPTVAARPSEPVSDYEPVRVVLSIPAPSRAKPPGNSAPELPRVAVKSAKDVSAPVRPASMLPGEIASAFNDASDAGIRRAVGAINDASPEDRAAALATLGQTLRSGSTAVRILDKLGPRDQVAVCSELALDPSLRAVALHRLRSLTDDPDVGADARAAVRALAAAPGMTTWLRSYGLLEDPPKPTSLDASPALPAMS